MSRWDQQGGSEEGSPRDEPQGNPRDLHPTSDIRFVIGETAKLTERVDGLSRALSGIVPLIEKALEKSSSDLKERVLEVKADGRETRERLRDIEKAVSFVKGAIWVFGGLFAVALVIIGVVLRAKLRI